MCTVSTSPEKPAAKGDGYHHGNLRQALVEAGRFLLTRDGNTDFSLREAARLAGVTVNASYRHFADKNALIAAISAVGFRELGDRLLAGAARGNSNETRMLEAAHEYVDFARDHPALFRLMFGRFGVRGHGPELDAATEHANSVLRLGVSTLLGPEATAAEIDIAVLKAWAVVHGISHLVIDGQIDANAPNYRELVRTLLQGYRPN